MPLEPISRIEHFLARIAGDSTALVLEPVTRIEHFLQRIIDTGVSVPPEKIADATSAWLGENITNPSNPPLDTSLSVSGAAADAKIVGDTLATGVMLRGTLAANTDMDTVIQPGMYYKAKNVMVLNMPDGQTAYRARIVVFSANSDTAVFQLWINVQANSTYIRTKNTESTVFTAWKKIAYTDYVESYVGAQIANALLLRPALTADTDMDTVIQPGMYYKAKNVGLVNAPSDSTTRARIVVFSGGGETSVVQLWCVTDTNKIWHRMKSAETASWSAWTQAADIDDLDSALDTALTLRPTLTADTDMDDVIQPGMYYKAKNVGLVNAPSDSTTRARIVVFSGGGETSVVQLWCVTDTNKIWHRMKSAETASWSAWLCDADTASGSGDRYPGSVFSRTADVYAALDELEDSSGGRITHTAITTDSLDSTDLPEGETADDNKMRLYKIDTTPAHIVSGGYTISNTPLYPKPKALIIACQHGDEKASATYVVDFVRRLLTDPELNSVASAVEWHIVPVVNVYGFNHNTRDSGPVGSYGTYDINRDYSDTVYTRYNKPYGFQTVEARAIKQLYLDNKYIFFLDVHQAGSSGGCGFTSVPNQLSNRLSDYKKLWRAIDRAGCTAQIWMQTDPNTVKTNDQITFNWGNPSDPPIGSNTTASASAYIRGNPYWNTHVAEQNPVFCAGTIETQKRCTKISGSNVDYNRVAMCFGAVYVQAIIKELVETVLDNFDVYD